MPKPICYLDLVEANSGEQLTAILWSDGYITRGVGDSERIDLGEFFRNKHPDLDVQGASAYE